MVVFSSHSFFFSASSLSSFHFKNIGFDAFCVHLLVDGIWFCLFAFTVKNFSVSQTFLHLPCVHVCVHEWERDLHLYAFSLLMCCLLLSLGIACC